jgi:type IV pilus assembly protein PilY1
MKSLARVCLAFAALALVGAAGAANTDISSSPMEVGASNTVVKPNVMLLFDDSGSMAWDFMPDWIGPSPLPGSGVDKPRCSGGGGGGGGGGGHHGGGGSACSPSTTIGLQGDPPYYAYQFNGVYYNPGVYYPPGVTATGTPMTTYNAANSSNWTRVPNDAYGTVNGTINLVTGFPEAVFCNASSVTPPSTNCKRNGIDTTNPFLYNLGSASNGYPDAVIGSGSGSVSVNLNGSDTVSVVPGTYENPAVQGGNPFYYTITPAEYCSDAALTTCILSTTPPGSGSSYTNAAPIRYCLLASDQNSVSAVSGTTTVSWSSTPQPKCQKKYNQRLGYQYPRFGYFNRYDIVSTTATYTRNANRTDCAAAPSCTYAEEMTNIANWYAYYHVRIQMAKSAVGLAFNTLTSAYRVGFLTINAYAGGGLDSSKFLSIGDFTAAQKSSFYSSFYALPANNGTPLREALSRVGQYYAGLTRSTALDYGMINSTTHPDPVQYSCQQNFTILTTDGYWNGNAGQDLHGNSIDYNSANGNQDNNASNLFEARGNTIYGPGGYFDGNLANSSFNGQTYTSIGTLADVSMYYYKSDLRPAGSTNYNTGTPVSTDDANAAQVPTAQYIDENPAQHMVTYTIGLGVDGYLTYDTSLANPSYQSADYHSIVTGTVGACVWTPGNVCDWPQVPTGTGYNDDPAKDDDLWHAAINGRGSYLSAKNPQALLRGLARDLATIQVQVGAAAASATSTPNITFTNDAIYSTTFQTAYWNGELTAQTIDASTGQVQAGVSWTESTSLIAKVNTNSDTRTIYTLSSGALTAFRYLSLDAAAQAYFNNACGAPPVTPPLLSQCSSLALTDQVIDNVGANLVNYLRGQSAYADGTHYRSRTQTNSTITNVLGDLVDSRPAVVNVPLRHYADTPIGPAYQSYATFAANNASRESVIYVGGNDGMLHAFDATTGNELWAYIPRMLLPRLYALADVAYPTQHQFFLDGSPEVADVLSPGDGTWHTILVEGLNDGGRGYFALDVTNPTSPQFLWEFCNDSSLCPTHNDANLGLSFGNPVVTKRAYDGKWVVLLTSGYNNNVLTSAGTTGDGMGHLYELDPFSGSLLATISNGVGSTATPSGLARISAMVTNPDTDNTAQYVYGGDLQGNLWRFNLTGASLAVSTMATLKDAAGKPQSITTRPELGQVNNYPVVYVGTGRLLGISDLQDPATLSPAGNWSYVSSIYALLENGTNLGNPRTNTSMVVQTLTAVGTAQRAASSNAVHIPTNIGWMLDFPTTGERVNVDPQLVLGTLVVTTNIPLPSACSAGGNSWLYQFGYDSGGAVTGTANNVVGTETTGAMTVGNVVVQLPSQSVKIISTESNGTKVTSGLNTNSVNPTVRRVGWREVQQ